MKAIGYTRVSTDRQAKDGASLEVQARKIEQYAEFNEMELVNVHTDRGISGKRADNRAGLQAAIEQAKHEQAVLIVYSLSRLSRTTRDTLRIEEELDGAGGNLASIRERIDTTTAAGNMVFRVLAVLAQFEREQLGERITASIEHRKTNGRVYGRVPFGYFKVKRRLKPAKDEQAVIKRIYTARTNGASLRKIAAGLNAEGIPGKRGGKWYASTVAYILNNQIHEGQTWNHL